jgi:hypothetical protein
MHTNVDEETSTHDEDALGTFAASNNSNACQLLAVADGSNLNPWWNF